MITTTIGSFPKSAELLRARRRFAEEEIDAEALAAAEQQARSSVLAQQEELGLDLLVDGQMDRSDLIGAFAERLDGVEVGGFVRIFDNHYYRKPRIVAAPNSSGPWVAESWRAAQQATQHPVKAVITGPYTLMDWSFDEHHDSRRACCMALADILRTEVDALVAAGATEIQLDEPAISCRAEEMGLVSEALSHVTSGVRGKARLWLWVGYGELKPIAGQLVGLPVDGLLIEAAHSNFAALDALAGLPQDRWFGAGVIDSIDPRVESVDEIQLRIERLQSVVPADRLVICPDAGLRGLDATVAAEKLRNMVTAARSF